MLKIENTCTKENMLKPFLQQCALRSQDFAVCHTEYIRFENPERCGSTLSTDSVRRKLKSVQYNFSRAEIFLTAVKNLHAEIILVHIFINIDLD